MTRTGYRQKLFVDTRHYLHSGTTGRFVPGHPDRRRTPSEYNELGLFDNLDYQVEDRTGKNRGEVTKISFQHLLETDRFFTVPIGAPPGQVGETQT